MATASSWIVCGIVLRILYPSLAIPSVDHHLSYFPKAFVAVNGANCCCHEDDGSTADLVPADRLRRRRSALARTWIALARRPAAAKAPWWPPHELILLIMIAAAVDPILAVSSSAASLGPLATPRPNDNGRGAGRVAAPAADRPAA